MANTWDYLMRRKPLFLAILGIFLAGGLLAFSFVRKYSAPVATANPTDAAAIDDDSGPADDVAATTPAESTGQAPDAPSHAEPLPRLHFKIANPSEVAALDPSGALNNPLENAPLLSENPSSGQPSDSSAEDNVAGSTPAASPAEVEVPLTGEPDPVRTWYNIAVSTTLALLLGLLTVAGAHLVHSYYRAK